MLDFNSLPRKIYDEYENVRTGNKNKSLAINICENKAEPKLLTGQISVTKAFNERFPMETVLRQRGDKEPFYEGGKWTYVDSKSGSPSIHVNDNKMYSHSESDPLSDGNSHDSFDVYKSIHGFDHSQAVIEASKLLKVDPNDPNSLTVDAHNKQVLQASKTVEAFKQSPVSSLPATPAGENPLQKFSLKGRSAEMKKQMQDEVYIAGLLVLLGQATVFYAPPNMGKTLILLWLLVDAVKKGKIKGNNIYYINADDTFRGLITKLEIVEPYGINMLCPGHDGFETHILIQAIEQMIATDTAKGVVIVLDTVKKFMDHMDKKSSSIFSNIIRKFTSKGGTVIALSHVNKNRGSDNKLIYAGVSDLKDDTDCVYIIDESEAGTMTDTKTVIFENVKSRGDNAKTASYSYLTKQGNSYHQIFNSVKSLDQDKTQALLLEDTRRKFMENDQPVIDAILSAISSGVRIQTEIVNYCKNYNFGRTTVEKVLNGYKSGDCKQWFISRGDKNSKLYYKTGEQAPAPRPPEL